MKGKSTEFVKQVHVFITIQEQTLPSVQVFGVRKFTLTAFRKNDPLHLPSLQGRITTFSRHEKQMYIETGESFHI